MTGTLEGCKKMTPLSHFRPRVDEGAMRISRFTLLETVAVLAIMAVILGLALPTIGRIPVFLSLEGAAHPVQELLQDAGIRSLHQGKLVTVKVTKNVEADSLTFTITDAGPGGIYSPPQAGLVTVEPPIAVTFPELSTADEDVVYKFYPDGGAAGPEMNLSLHGRILILGVSPLTGLVYRREANE
jgi:Tfp pilus assembly protein FimT